MAFPTTQAPSPAAPGPVAVVDRLKNLPLMSVVQEILEYPKLQMGDDQARVCVMEPHFTLQLNWDNGPLACARFLSLYVALPFFALYGCYCNLAIGAVKLAAGGVLFFRKEEEGARQMAANAVQHIAFAVYDLVCGLFVTASLLHIPVLPTIYVIAPGQILQMHHFFTDKEEGLLTGKMHSFVINLLTPPKEPEGGAKTPPETPIKGSRRRISLSNFSPASFGELVKRVLAQIQPSST